MLKKENAIRVDIIKYHRKNCKFYVYNCSICSSEIKYKNSDLKRVSGTCKKCADLNKLNKARTVDNKSKIRPYEALYKNLLKGAKRKNKYVDLTYEEFLSFAKIEHCEYCLGLVFWTKHNITKNSSRYNLDRKDNSLGYTKDNCTVCCWKCNDTKGNRYSHAQFYDMTRSIRNENIKKTEYTPQSQDIETIIKLLKSIEGSDFIY